MELRRFINMLVANVYEQCDITSFPFNCEKVIKYYGFECRGYSTLSAKKLEICKRISDDACIIDKTIFYNDRKSHHRIVFTLMHELGHILLGHHERNEAIEEEADLFASMILAPRIVVHKMKLQTADEIRDYFDISISASNRVVCDYKRWWAEIANTTRKPSKEEQEIQDRFFPSEQSKTIKYNHKHASLRFFIESTNDEYIIAKMEKRRTDSY